MSEQVRYVIALAGVWLVVIGLWGLAMARVERRRLARQRANWERRCARWMAEGVIHGYGIGREEVVIEFGSNEWHHYSL